MVHDVASRSSCLPTPAFILARIACTAFIVLATALNQLGAQDSAPKDASSQKGSALGILVMQNGRVVNGRISHCAAGYMVEKENGSMMVPRDLVQFEAADLFDAHRKLQKRVPEQTPDTRLNLARWCLANHIYDEAKNEVREALDLDPANQEARTMLERIELLQKQAAAKTVDTTAKPAQTADGFRPRGPVSLSGLKPETVREFSSRIQPILLNKCGNASCHGSASANAFRLEHPRGGNGNRRRVVEDNLTAILGQLDTDKPKQSPLLVVPSGNHGRGGRPLFAGARDKALRDTLEAWVKQVVAEKTGKDDATATAARSNTPDGVNNSAFKRNSSSPELSVLANVAQVPFPNMAGNSPATANGTNGIAKSPQDTAPSPEEPTGANAKGDKVASDPFDPAAFNRAKFGSAKKK